VPAARSPPRPTPASAAARPDTKVSLGHTSCGETTGEATAPQAKKTKEIVKKKKTAAKKF